MPVVAAVEIPMETKDAREAVLRWLEILEQGSQPGHQPTVQLSLSAMSDGGVVEFLAERLPHDALGFHGGFAQQRAATAEEFRSGPKGMGSNYQGVLTEHLSVGESLQLIRDLFQCPPKAVRSTAFHVQGQNIHWRGAGEGCLGELSLFDMKGFRRKRRFHLTATVHLPGNRPDDPEVINTLAEIQTETGLDFQSSQRSLVPDRAEPAKRTPRDVLIGQVCFDEAVETAAERLGQTALPFTPNLLSNMEALQQRMQQWGSGTSRVNFPSTVKRIFKTDLPDWTFESNDADTLRFQKRVEDVYELLLDYDKTMPLVGKAFSLRLGLRCVEGPCAGLQWVDSVFRLLEYGQPPSWVYSTKEEAEKMVRESVILLQAVLPEFEKAVAEYFRPWPADLPEGIERREGLSARQAMAEAEPLLRTRWPAAKLCAVFNHGRSLMVRDTNGPALGTDGRLGPNGVWWLQYVSISDGVAIAVLVPALGRIRVIDQSAMYASSGGAGLPQPIGSQWIDSDEAVAIAEESGARAERQSCRTFDILSKLQAYPFQIPSPVPDAPFGEPVWEIHYLLTDERGRNDFQISIDARDGRVLDKKK